MQPAIAEPVNTAESSQTRPVPPQLARFAFNSANARQFNAMSIEARRKRSEPVAQPAQNGFNVLANAEHTHTQADLKLVQEQIDQTRKVLNDKTPYCPACERCELEPHHRAQLLKALDSLLARKSALLGIHLPGPSKAPRESNRRSPVIVLPQESLDPGPVQPVKPVEPKLCDPFSEV